MPPLLGAIEATVARALEAGLTTVLFGTRGRAYVTNVTIIVHYRAKGFWGSTLTTRYDTFIGKDFSCYERRRITATEQTRKGAALKRLLGAHEELQEAFAVPAGDFDSGVRKASWSAAIGGWEWKDPETFARGGRKVRQYRLGR